MSFGGEQQSANTSESAESNDNTDSQENLWRHFRIAIDSTVTSDVIWEKLMEFRRQYNHVLTRKGSSLEIKAATEALRQLSIETQIPELEELLDKFNGVVSAEREREIDYLFWGQFQDTINICFQKKQDLNSEPVTNELNFFPKPGGMDVNEQPYRDITLPTADSAEQGLDSDAVKSTSELTSNCPDSCADTLALLVYPRIRENYVILGPNGTEVELNAYNGIQWTSPASATNQLLKLVFSDDVLATHSLTGNYWSEYRAQGRPGRMLLDPNKVADLTHCVQAITNCTERKVRAAITRKCSESAKKHSERLLRSMNTPLDLSLK